MLVTTLCWIVADFTRLREHSCCPDLLISSDVDLSAYRASNGYVIAEQGKPHDFVLEVVSP